MVGGESESESESEVLVNWYFTLSREDFENSVGFLIEG